MTMMMRGRDLLVIAGVFALLSAVLAAAAGDEPQFSLPEPGVVAPRQMLSPEAAVSIETGLRDDALMNLIGEPTQQPMQYSYNLEKPEKLEKLGQVVQSIPLALKKAGIWLPDSAILNNPNSQNAQLLHPAAAAAATATAGAGAPSQANLNRFVRNIAHLRLVDAAINATVNATSNSTDAANTTTTTATTDSANATSTANTTTTTDAANTTASTTPNATAAPADVANTATATPTVAPVDAANTAASNGTTPEATATSAPVPSASETPTSPPTTGPETGTLPPAPTPTPSSTDVAPVIAPANSTAATPTATAATTPEAPAATPAPAVAEAPTPVNATAPTAAPEPSPAPTAAPVETSKDTSSPTPTATHYILPTGTSTPEPSHTVSPVEVSGSVGPTWNKNDIQIFGTQSPDISVTLPTDLRVTSDYGQVITDASLFGDTDDIVKQDPRAPPPLPAELRIDSDNEPILTSGSAPPTSSASSSSPNNTLPSPPASAPVDVPSPSPGSSRKICAPCTCSTGRPIPMPFLCRCPCKDNKYAVGVNFANYEKDIMLDSNDLTSEEVRNAKRQIKDALNVDATTLNRIQKIVGGDVSLSQFLARDVSSAAIQGELDHILQPGGSAINDATNNNKLAQNRRVRTGLQPGDDRVVSNLNTFEDSSAGVPSALDKSTATDCVDCDKKLLAAQQSAQILSEDQIRLSAFPPMADRLKDTTESTLPPSIVKSSSAYSPTLSAPLLVALACLALSWIR